MPAVTLSASARRYAEAAFSVARETGDYDAWLTALDAVVRLLDDPQAATVFTSPAVDPSDKQKALDRLVPRAPRLIHNFLAILIERDRVSQVPAIAEALRERVNEERGILTADVTTAVPLDAELQKTIARRLGTQLGHDPTRLVIRPHVDPAIIGGVVARVGDTLIDDSVRGRIERLRRALAGSGR